MGRTQAPSEDDLDKLSPDELRYRYNRQKLGKHGGVNRWAKFKPRMKPMQAVLSAGLSMIGLYAFNAWKKTHPGGKCVILRPWVVLNMFPLWHW